MSNNLTKDEFCNVSDSGYLCKTISNDLTKDEFWNVYDSGYLCETFANYFNIWWDKKKFDYYHKSWALCQYLPHKFNIWWNPYKFNWDKVDYLRYHLFNKITDWYIPDAIDFNINSLKRFISDWEWNYD